VITSGFSLHKVSAKQKRNVKITALLVYLGLLVIKTAR